MGHSLYNSKITGNVIRGIDQEIKREGLDKAMESIFRKTHTKIEMVKESPLIDEVLKKEPTIVICNHPSEVEVLIMLMAMKGRKDVFIVANHNFTKILPNLDCQIIPVYIADRLTDDKGNWKFRIMKKIHKVEHYCKDICHKKNIESINLASKKVSQGALVIIFPAAGVKSGKFLNGVGYMIKNLTNREKVKLIMAYVKGTSTLDYFRLVPGLNRLMPKIKISFAHPIDVSKYSGEDAKVITSEVEKDYYKWINKIDNAK